MIGESVYLPTLVSRLVIRGYCVFHWDFLQNYELRRKGLWNKIGNFHETNAIINLNVVYVRAIFCVHIMCGVRSCEEAVDNIRGNLFQDLGCDLCIRIFFLYT